MHKITKLLAIIPFVALAACQGTDSTKVQALQKKDKNLSCTEVMLELNEAEFYRKTAETNKGPKLKSVLMPLGYVSTYMNAEDAVDAANSRIDYLNRIYEILSCEKQEARRDRGDVSPVGGYIIPNSYFPTSENEPVIRAQQHASKRTSGLDRLWD